MLSFHAHLPAVLRMSAEASVLIVLVFAAQWLCGPRLKPRWRYALWLLVLLRLALPWTIPSPASLFNLAKLPAIAQPVPAEASPVTPASAPAPVSGTPAATEFTRRVDMLTWLWAAGALCLAAFALADQYGLLHRVKRLRPIIDGPTLTLFEDCRALMGVTVPVALVETDAIACPAVLGFVRPRILLPKGLVSTFTPGELRHVFLHELAHIKRHDIFVAWVTLALQVAHWFNPLVWLAFHRLRADRELACDALALSRAQTGENESYGLTVVKLLEGFGKAAWRPGLAGILEEKQQMKRRIHMIAKFHKTDRGLALAAILATGLALVTLTDAQTQPPRQGANVRDPDAAKGVWAVRFEPAGDFSPKTPGEFLDKIHIYSGQHGEIGYFRTTRQGNKLAGSFLAYDGEALKAALSGIPELKVTAVDKLDQAQLDTYKKSPQESVFDFNHLDAALGIWVVRFEPAGDFSPRTPREFLAKIPIHSFQSGELGFFRTTKQGNKLVGSFLAYDGDQLKAALAKIPQLKITSVEKLTQEQLDAYQKLPQESLSSLQLEDK